MCLNCSLKLLEAAQRQLVATTSRSSSRSPGGRLVTLLHKVVNNVPKRIQNRV